MFIPKQFSRIVNLPIIAIAAFSISAYAETTPTQYVDSLNGVFGKHEGYRAVHAKGIVLEGDFAPAKTASSISKASHFQKKTVPVTVRFSDFAGIPDIADNHGLAAPRGMAIKFHLPDGSETDLVTHSFNGFPTPTAEEFHDLLMALGSSGPDAAKPTALDNYLGSHPIAKAFLTAPKPAPVSYATLPYFGVNTFKFINKDSKVSYARYQILPVGGEHYLTDEETKQAAPDYLVQEIQQRAVKSGAIKFRLVAEIAEPSDNLDDPSVAWPASRKKVELGTISINKVSADNKATEKKLVFMPSHLTPGIEVQDPMVNIRSSAYAVSYSNRLK
jgi:catalase